MKRERKTYSAEFKGRLAIEAIRGFKTINELAAEYGVHPNQISIQYVEGSTATSRAWGVLRAC